MPVLDPVKMAGLVKMAGPAARRVLRALVRIHGLPSHRNSLASINENKSMWRSAIEDSDATCCSKIYESRKQRRFTSSLSANRYETLEGNYLLSRRWENNQAYSSGFEYVTVQLSCWASGYSVYFTGDPTAFKASTISRERPTLTTESFAP